jgi:hypothetical protein
VMHLPVHSIAVFDTSTPKVRQAFRKLGTTQGQITDRKAYARFAAKANEKVN